MGERINSKGTKIMNAAEAKKIELETGKMAVRSFEDSDDRGVWFGLEQWTGNGWASLSPAHPTFFTRGAADAYIRLKFA